MRRVANHPLWIGHALDSADLRAVHAEGIEALIDLAINEPVPKISRELVYCRFPILDGIGNRLELLRLAVSTTSALLRAGTPTLVFCSAGMSRSPAVAAAALAVATDRSAAECLAEVIAGAPADLAPGLWQELMKLVSACQSRSGEIV